jgi:hypothetical protein
MSEIFCKVLYNRGNKAGLSWEDVLDFWKGQRMVFDFWRCSAMMLECGGNLAGRKSLKDVHGPNTFHGRSGLGRNFFCGQRMVSCVRGIYEISMMDPAFQRKAEEHQAKTA